MTGFRFTAEPIHLIFCFSFVSLTTYVPQLLLYKTCLQEYNQNTTLCDNISANKDLQANVQDKASFWQMLYLVTTNVIAFFAVLIWGPLTDVIGRKKGFIYASIVLIIVYVVTFLNAYFIHLPFACMLIPAVLTGSYGDSSGTISLSYAYVADVTEESNRTKRMALLESFFYFGFLLGGLSCGYLIKYFGFIFVPIVNGGIVFLAFLYTCFILSGKSNNDTNRLIDNGYQVRRIRSIHQRPSYQVIILDLSHEQVALENVYTSLSEYLSLAASISGPMRIELFSLYAIQKCSECIVPVQRFRMNFKNIVNLLRKIIIEKEQSAIEDTKSFQENFRDCLSEVSTQIQSFIHGSTSKQQQAASSNENQLDVCIITSHQHGSYERWVAETIRDVNNSLIKKVQIVHVNCGDNGISDMKCSNDSDGSLDSGTAEIICEYVESVYIENTSSSFLNHFKSWLKESGSDDIHLLIKFSNNLELSCDVVDTLLNPISLLDGYEMFIESELNCSSQKSSNSSSLTSRVKTLPIYKLQTKCIVKLDGVCESVLFGVPFVIKPTSCWKLDWEDLESNQNVFGNVCSFLQNKNSGLILQGSASKYNPHFLLLPSSNNSMLIKSIVTSECVMPTVNDVLDSNKTFEKNDAVVKTLQEIEQIETYNPYNFSSGIFQVASSQVNKCHSGKKPNPYHIGFIDEEMHPPSKVKTTRPQKNLSSISANLIPGSAKYTPTFKRASQQQTQKSQSKKRKGFTFQDTFPKKL